MRFSDNVNLTFSATVSCHKYLRNRMQFIGTRKSIFVEGRKLKVVTDNGISDNFVFENESKREFHDLWIDYLKCVRTKREPICSLQKSINSHLAIQKILNP